MTDKTHAKKIIDMISEVQYTVDTDVHEKHGDKVEKFLNDHKVPHTKTKHQSVQGYPFYRFGFRPEFLPMFHSMCVQHDKDNDGDDPIQTGGLAQIAGVSPGSMGGDGSSTGGGDATGGTA